MIQKKKRKHPKRIETEKLFFTPQNSANRFTFSFFLSFFLSFSLISRFNSNFKIQLIKKDEKTAKKKNVQKLIQNKNYKYTQKKNQQKNPEKKKNQIKRQKNFLKSEITTKENRRRNPTFKSFNMENSKELQGQHNIQMTEKSTEIELKSKLFRLPLSLCASVCCSGSGTVDIDFKLIDFGLIDALGINSPVLMITSDNPPAAFSSI